MKFEINESVLFETVPNWVGTVVSTGEVMHGNIESEGPHQFYYIQGTGMLTGIYYIHYTKIHKLTNINKALYL